MSIDFIQRWHEAEPLLDRLLELPVTEQADWLCRNCEDATLRVLVAGALAQAPVAEALERGMGQWLPALSGDLPDKLPAIPGYRLLQFVGAGGMASVFEAERELPGGPQKVALKLLRIDVHDAGERRRFLREQRILARLQHPHIAQLLDAGFSPTGTPFLTLEFIAGGNLVQHCEKHGIDVRGRLALFIDVSKAVEHAHRNLIVHRDLKPSNVLVGEDGCVKLVDFGIAKLLTGENENAQTHTEVRRLTRAYAAPEQIIGHSATTSVDVYALGVLLAELLSGLQPRRIDKSGVMASVFDDGPLRQKLGVDLHAIVHAAIHPDPVRRYASAAALREDVERYLAGKPLHARADTLAYRALTFAKRHALAVSAGIIMVTLLASATAAGLYESYLARHAAKEARAQALAALGEAQREDALKSFMEGLFDNVSHGAEASAEVLLAQGRERADRDFAKQPALHVEILGLIGDLERRSGHVDRAQQPLEEAASLAQAQFGVTDRRTLHVEYLLAEEADELGHVRSGRLRLQNAIEAFQSGPNHDSPEEVQALAWLAGLDERLGESKKAIDIGVDSVALARRVLPDDSDALTEAVTNLGWIWMDAGHPDRAEPLLREALVRKRARFGDRHPEVADAMTLLTTALLPLGRYGESEMLMRSALDIDAGAYAGPNTHVASDQNNLANVLIREGKFAEAGTLYTKSLAMDRKLAAAPSLGEAITIGHLAHVRFNQGAYADAEAGLRDAIARKQRLLGKDYDDNGRSHDGASLAEILTARGRIGEAKIVAGHALAEARQRHRDAHPDVAFALTVEAEVAAASGARERAATFAGEAVAMYVALADQSSEDAIRARILFGETLRSLGRSGGAKRQLESALVAADTITPKTTSLIAHIDADLAGTEASLGNRPAAERFRIQAESLLAGIDSEQNSESDATMHMLAVALPAAAPTGHPVSITGSGDRF
jgi:serine/threonine-protein kinase